MSRLKPIAAAPSLATARVAGALYLLIILLGLTSELALRGPLLAPDDAAETAARMLSAPWMLRAGLAADVLMAMADVALAVLLYRLLRAVEPLVALLAMAFRLVQAVLIGVALLALHTGLLALELGADAHVGLLAMLVHAHGYDLGLAFFGVNSLLTAWLLLRSGWVPGVIGWLLGAAGLVYLVGSALRFLAPPLADPFAMAYILPVVAETAFCLWLLLQGLRPRRKVSR